MHVCSRHQYQRRSALTMANLSHNTRCGLPGIERVRDARLHFYSSSDQLVTALVPYAVAGEEERALAEGYNGLRIAGDTRFLTAGDWSTFMEYEHAVTARCNGRRIVALCSCALAQCNDQQMSAVMHAHQCALERLDADWQVFAVPKFLGSFESRW
jgi:MEDS: MEthanogen/methylotroph, DcmR Sensory domain